MSFADDGRQVMCDGHGCLRRAALPVALHPWLSVGVGEAQSNGWLFVIGQRDSTGQSDSQHFCPKCGARHLQEMGLMSAAPSHCRSMTVFSPQIGMSEKGVMFKKILVPVDGSPKSLRAAEAVAELAAAQAGTFVVLVLAIECLRAEESDYDEAMVETINAQANERAQCALASAARIFALRGILHETKVLTGSPVSAVIAQEAAEGDYDLVAMGSRGMGMQRADPHYLGSITEHVLRRVAIPVLVLPDRPGDERSKLHAG